MTATEVYQAAKQGAKDGLREGMIELMKSNFSQAEAARLLEVSPITIGRWIKSGRITATKSGKISRSEVLRLLNE